MLPAGSGPAVLDRVRPVVASAVKLGAGFEDSGRVGRRDAGAVGILGQKPAVFPAGDLASFGFVSNAAEVGETARNG